eukprot:1480081-Rhodomonas_salina.1
MRSCHSSFTEMKRQPMTLDPKSSYPRCPVLAAAAQPGGCTMHMATSSSSSTTTSLSSLRVANFENQLANWQ